MICLHKSYYETKFFEHETLKKSEGDNQKLRDIYKLFLDKAPQLQNLKFINLTPTNRYSLDFFIHSL